MKNITKHLMLILVLFCISLNLFSQPKLNDSLKSQAYLYWASHGILELIYANMQDYLVIVDTNKFSEENEGSHKYFVKFIADINNKSIKDLGKDLQFINSFLKNNGWASTEKKLCIPLIDNYNQHKPLDDHFFTINVLYNDNKKWNEKKKDILNGYGEDLKLIDENQKKNVKTVTPKKLSDDGKTRYIENDTGLLIYIFLSFSVGLIIGGLSIYQISKSRISKILSDEIWQYSDDLRKSHERYLFQYIGLFEVLKKHKDEYKTKAINGVNNTQMGLNRQINDLNVENTKLKNENNDLKVNIGRYLNNYYEKKSIDLTHVSDKKEDVLITNTIYFTIPESDGVFKITNGKNTKEKDCFYKIEVEKNNQKGKLFFISSDFDSRALDDIDSYLNPVCEIENIAYRTQAKKILVVKEGYVAMNGENWKIDSNNKLKIRLI